MVSLGAGSSILGCQKCRWMVCHATSVPGMGSRAEALGSEAKLNSGVGCGMTGLMPQQRGVGGRGCTGCWRNRVLSTFQKWAGEAQAQLGSISSPKSTLAFA